MRKLRADEIECRVATVSKKGCSLLLYKDARVDMRLLDEEYGPMNWQRHHQSIDGNLYCTISVWDKDKKCWVEKQDVGTESYTEKEKGQASDSFKRSGFCWNIGRELYTAPFIWISAGDVKLIDKGNDKYSTYDHFTLKHIAYDGDNISELEIVNDKLKRVVYTFGGRLAVDETTSERDTDKKHKPVLNMDKTDQEKFATEDQIDQIKDICDKDNVPISFILGNYKVDDLKQLRRSQAHALVNQWRTVTNSWSKEKAKRDAEIEEAKKDIPWTT